MKDVWKLKVGVEQYVRVYANINISVDERSSPKLRVKMAKSCDIVDYKHYAIFPRLETCMTCDF